MLSLRSCCSRLTKLRPSLHIPLSRASIVSVSRPLLSLAKASSSSQPSSASILRSIGEGVDGRLLDLVKRLADERTRLLSETADAVDASSPEVIAKAKRAKDLEDLSDIWDKLRSQEEDLRSTLSLIESDPDPDLRALASEDLPSLRASLSTTLSTLPSLVLSLVPSGLPAQGALLELQAGVGGLESTMLLTDMLRMYTRHASAMKWRADEFGLVAGDAGGALKKAMVEVRGEGAWEGFRWERGVHRFLRQKNSTMQTSTVGVMVFPIVEGGSASDDVLDEKDVKVDVMRSGGAGGQHVNKTESAVRLTHLPTGIVVSMQDTRSQHQNRTKAFQILRARLLDRRLQAEAAERQRGRRQQISRLDMHEKVRSYDYPHDRVMDHRLARPVPDLQAFLGGKGLEIIARELKDEEDRQRLEDMLEEGI